MDSKNLPVGSSHVCCHGKCVMGPDRRTALVSLMMILVPCGFYEAFTVPWIYQQYGAALPILSVILFCTTVILFCITAVTDPGIIPRQENPLRVHDPITGEARNKLPQRYHDLVVNGYPLRIKFCSTCNLYRPPRSVHCAICDNCVERFDHHCPWIGNCIGRRNYKSFIAFVVSCTFLCILVFGTSIIKVVHVCVELNATGSVFPHIWKRCTESVFLALYSFVVSWFLIALFSYHLFLISTNQTTYEQIKSFFYESTPWNRGFIGNISDWCFLSATPRNLHLDMSGPCRLEISSRPLPPSSGCSLQNSASSRKYSNDEMDIYEQGSPDPRVHTTAAIDPLSQDEV